MEHKSQEQRRTTVLQSINAIPNLKQINNLKEIWASMDESWLVDLSKCQWIQRKNKEDKVNFDVILSPWYIIESWEIKSEAVQKLETKKKKILTSIRKIKGLEKIEDLSKLWITIDNKGDITIKKETGLWRKNNKNLKNFEVIVLPWYEVKDWKVVSIRGSLPINPLLQNYSKPKTVSVIAKKDNSGQKTSNAQRPTVTVPSPFIQPIPTTTPLNTTNKTVTADQ
jgi:hypothetical protein